MLPKFWGSGHWDRLDSSNSEQIEKKRTGRGQAETPEGREGAHPAEWRKNTVSELWKIFAELWGRGHSRSGSGRITRVQEAEGRASLSRISAPAGSERPTACRDAETLKRLGRFFVCNPAFALAAGNDLPQSCGSPG